MFLRLQTIGFVPLAALLLIFGLGKDRVIAQTTYEFSATYDTLVTIDPSYRPELGISRATITGQTTDAPYGLNKLISNTYRLNKLISNTYSQFDPTTSTSTFDANPAVFGLQGEPVLSDRYYGGSNE